MTRCGRHGPRGERYRLQVGGEICDAERVCHVVGDCLDNNTGPLIGDRRCNLEAPVRHTSPNAPPCADRIGEGDRFTAAERFPRFGPGEEDVGRWAGDPGLSLSEAAPNTGDQVCAGKDRDCAGFDRKNGFVSPEDTGNPGADRLSEDRRLGVVGDDSIEVGDAVDTTSASDRDPSRRVEQCRVCRDPVLREEGVRPEYRSQTCDRERSSCGRLGRPAATNPRVSRGGLVAW